MAEYPTYRYRPPPGGVPRLRTTNATRARLFAAGTFFRAKEIGNGGNRLSIQVINYEGPPREGYFVVTNRNLRTSENVSAPTGVTPELLRLDISSLERVTIYNLNTTPRARRNSISLQIAPPPPPPALELGPVDLSRPIVIPGVLALKLMVEEGTVFSPSDEIVIQHRKEVYPLTPDATLLPPPVLGWNISSLRTLVNSSSQWLQLPPRGYDAQDGPIPGIPPDGPTPPEDAEVLDLELPETFLFGGSGFPETPIQESTGPARSLVHINYGENEEGVLREISQVYEWAGDSATDGGWVKYQ
jgi:hypothetical protein